jgi:UDP-N-acetylglucosamine 4,6-dehydratase
MAPGLPVKIIGIRPGEKLHELMISRDDSPITLEFDDHYVITPSIRFVLGGNYTTNGLGQSGQPAGEGFKYASDTNPVFLSVQDIRVLSNQAA